MEERLQALEAKMDRLTRLVESTVAWQGKFADFVDEMSPVARAMMDTGIVQLAKLEQQGHFGFGRDLVEALDRAVQSYQPGSLPRLADSFGDLLLILHQLTQVKILAAVQDVAEEFGKSAAEPIEVLGTAKRIETEKDLQRGLGLAMDLFGSLGRSVSRAPRLRAGQSAPRPARPQPVVRLEEASPAVSRGEEFAFVPDDQWSQQWAQEMAGKLGVGPLGEDKWRIIEFSRKDYKESKKAPNIRRITKSLDIATKEVYALFPSAPGTTISRLAGVPKPAGCL
ncbi:TusE/DsrC/DsvC family sulfur relay protein [bacterium]|nr:TusE/DsrC/DsvC family sulfur relay protein [bacterium]